jgi:hypothetical protein
MQRAFLTVLGILVFLQSYGQKSIHAINDLIVRNEIEAHLSFLASDEMRGRNAGTPELDIAANYIRSYFKMYGLKPAPGTNQYFQAVDQIKRIAPRKAELRMGDLQFTYKENLLLAQGEEIQWSGDMIYVGYGSAEELKRYDLKGKMVLALAGARDADTYSKAMTANNEKHKLVGQLGAVGLVELLTVPQIPWPTLVSYLGQSVWGIEREGVDHPHVFVKVFDINSVKYQEGEKISGSLVIEGKRKIHIPGKNVAAMVEGTDPGLKDEYIIVTAHYDHIGIRKTKESTDSIFNGARDNAVGTVALLETAKFLSQNPPKHSVLLVAVTSEEKGMLGSQWYTEHPLVPLHQHILSVNCDGVGFNDTSIITSISIGRTNTDDVIRKAAKTFGLAVGGDPDPKENFFERSDQVSFARKGIPAIKLQPGLARMDDEIRKYYHRAADEVATLDFEYLVRFYRTFVYAIHLLANENKRPAWNPGDKFEEVSKKLYGEI